MSYKTRLKEFYDLDELLDTTEDLLEACEEQLKWLEVNHGNYVASGVFKKLQQAINKAKGGLK